VRPSGQPFSGRLSTVGLDSVTSTPPTGSGLLFAILLRDKLSVNGRFEGISSPATFAHLHSKRGGLRGQKIADLTVTNETRGTLKGSLTLTDAQIEELKKGSYYVQIDTEKNPQGELRGWLLEGELK
jgi:hypothetical protein